MQFYECVYEFFGLFEKRKRKRERREQVEQAEEEDSKKIRQDKIDI